MIVRWKMPGTVHTGNYVLSGKFIGNQVNTTGAISTGAKNRGFTLNVGRLLRTSK